MYKIKGVSRLRGHVIFASLRRIKCGYRLHIQISRGSKRPKYDDVIVQDVSCAIDFLMDDYDCDFVVINKVSHSKIVFP